MLYYIIYWDIQSIPTGGSVLQLNVTDADAGLNGEVVYAFGQGNIWKSLCHFVKYQMPIRSSTSAVCEPPDWADHSGRQ